jgi:hypothetical protein
LHGVSVVSWPIASSVKGKFHCGEEAEQGFTLVMEKLCAMLVLECDASIVEIGAALSQPVEFISEKLGEAIEKWSTYEL